MHPKLLKTTLFSYVMAPWSGRNESGITPLNDHVLVLPDTASDSGGDQGLIHLPPDVIERAQLAAETGTIVALGDASFNWSADRTRRWEGFKPKAGDRVCFQRYSGQLCLGDDGRTYRLMEDKTIGGTWDRMNESVARRDSRTRSEEQKALEGEEAA